MSSGGQIESWSSRPHPPRFSNNYQQRNKELSTEKQASFTPFPRFKLLGKMPVGLSVCQPRAAAAARRVSTAARSLPSTSHR